MLSYLFSNISHSERVTALGVVRLQNQSAVVVHRAAAVTQVG